MNMLKFTAAIWIGACLRNENDRKKTIDFFNSLGFEAEKVIKSLFQGGGTINANSMQDDQSTEESQEFI